MQNSHVDIEIDKLTNSVENRISGDSFNTQVIELSNSDVSQLSSNWNFDWLAEFKNKDTRVFKLVIEQNIDIIQGLISLKYLDGFIFVELVENADFNIGRNKVYLGVAGNLFAFACKESWDRGDYGYVAFNAKTNLIPHYKETIGAIRIGDSNQMVLESQQALSLITKYYNS
ncbi:MAG: hypothetical protein JXR10_04240 [Cyclobacteriaceae bacterium]